MTPSMDIDGARGRLHVRRWLGDDVPRFVVVIAHGYGEHSGRYDHVAERLVAAGAAVYAPDHVGHGHSSGERALVTDADELVTDLGLVVEYADGKHPGLPLAMIGHSMGGIVATRFAQLHQDRLAALVLSGPVIGGNPEIQALLGLDPMPHVPIDPSVLSRDPAVAADYADDPLVYHGPFRRETLEAMFAAVDAIVAAGPLQVPTLWIHGSDDALAPLEITREAIARIRPEHLEERIYPDARHEVLNETNRGEVIGDVLAFLGRVVEPQLVPAGD